MTTTMAKHAEAYIRFLSEEISSRRVGSAGNLAATKFFLEKMSGFGFTVESTHFECIDWRSDGVKLFVGEEGYLAFASPYSLGCDLEAPLAVYSTIEELKRVDAAGRVLLLLGELVREQLMPKNFPFYNPDSHQEMIGLLEEQKPSAIITATSRDLDMVGGIYPFPVFEDGDFDIPSVYITDIEGERLAQRAGERVSLHSQAQRIPSHGWNVVARKGRDPHRRVVVFAHLDSRMGTPGANDNASGAAVLLLLGELLEDQKTDMGIELIAMNGEDYYDAPGEKLFVAQNEGHYDEILLGINLDDVGYYKGRAAYSLYGCPEHVSAIIHDTFSNFPQLVEGESWYSGDHGLFLIHQVPALALTSEYLAELMAEITHTPEDTADKVDPNKLAEVARALYALLLRLDTTDR